MPDTIIESVLTGKLDSVLLIKWLNNEAIEDDCILLSCKKDDFVACFLSYLRNQTDSILLTNSNAVHILQNSTPEKAHSSRRKHHRSISDPTSDDRDSLSVKTEKTHESPNRDRKRPGRRVKTTLFPDERKEVSVSSDESRLSSSMDRMAISSTPLKNGVKPSDYPNLPLSSPVTPRSYIKDGERCDTPRLSHRHSRSHEKSCLGDFLVTATKSSKKKTKKNVSNDNEEKLELDLSNSEVFPEIGARKSSSLRGEKKRIKPTNIDKSQKSLSLNSFNSDCFPSSPLQLDQNSAFKQKSQPSETANSFEAERNILKHERHKLMEKFNILNTAPQIVMTAPQIKITQKESVEVNPSYIKADVTKIQLKDKIDLLINIYDVLLSNNLILSVITEIYFLISIVISKQLEDDYINAESKLNDNNLDYILKSIHNSSYFAVKSLWNLKMILEVVLDKSSLKTLGENKKVRSFYPDLAKFLLNCYCVRCETAPTVDPPRGSAVVCYNMETDNADNFPGTQAFHNFKKQRDMFYEIVRWYHETNTTGGSKSSFRARLKSLLSHSLTPANHAHLASLFVAHMLAECLPGNTQESKLSKLHRRLTCPTARDTYRLPNFTSNEMFYKEFIMHAENESFRSHLRDALSTEIVTLNSTQFAVEDRGNSSNIDISRDYLQLEKKLMLLAKFLGFLASLPYSPVPIDAVSKNNNVVTLNKEQNYNTPKEKVLENSLALRSYSQPTIDLKGLLQNAIDNSRLSITIPWLVNYLSMLDYTTLHLPYYQLILKTLLEIYHTKLKLQDNSLKKNTIIYLKSMLGWLFDLPHFSDVESIQTSVGTESIDKCDLVDESIFELCPCLRDVNTLLFTCRLSQEQKDIGSFRHITPVSITIDHQARIKNKEKELQARLEEELLRAAPAHARRVLELAAERVLAQAVRELSAHDLPAARARARAQAQRALRHDQSSPLGTVRAQYEAVLRQLRAGAVESARGAMSARIKAALTALLPTAPAPLHSVACRSARNRLNTWINDHWNTTAVLCKDLESETKTLLALNEMRVPIARAPAPLASPVTDLPPCDESPAAVLIRLKEMACVVLEGGGRVEAGADAEAVAACAESARSALCRAPARAALLRLALDLCLIYVSRRPKDITEQFLLKFHALWNACCPDRKHYPPDNISVNDRREDLSPEPRNYTDDRLPTPVSDEEAEPGNKTEEPNQKTVCSVDPNSIVIDSITTATKVKIESYSKRINLNSQSSDPNSPIELNSSMKLDQNVLSRVTKFSPISVAPLTRITPFSQPTTSTSKIHPNITINTQAAESNLKIIESKTDTKEQSVIFEESTEHLLEYFDRILCPRNIVLLSTSMCKQSEVWDALSFLIVFLLKNDYLSEDSLTEQCLAVYRQDWHQVLLENLSRCMKTVSSNWSTPSTGKFTLFLDFLAEYCGDMDYEITE